MNEVLGLVIKELPNIIDLIKGIHTNENPNLPPLTDNEVVAILLQAISSSLVKDANWLAAHKGVN